MFQVPSSFVTNIWRWNMDFEWRYLYLLCFFFFFSGDFQMSCLLLVGVLWFFIRVTESESKSEFKHFLSHDFEPKLSKTTTNFRGRTHPQNSLIMFSTSILGFRNSLCEYLYHHVWIGRRFSGRWSLDRQLFIDLRRRPIAIEIQTTKKWLEPGKHTKTEPKWPFFWWEKALFWEGVDLLISIHFTV